MQYYLIPALFLLSTCSFAEPAQDAESLAEDLVFAEGDEKDALLIKIASFKDKRTQSALVQSLLSEPPPGTKAIEKAFEALNEMADAEIEEDVIQLAESDSLILRRIGIVLLGRMKTDRSAAVLITALESRTNDDAILRSIVHSIGRNGRARALPSLKKLAAKKEPLAGEIVIARFQVGDADALQPFFALYQERSGALANTAWEYGFRTGTAVEVRRLRVEKKALEDTLGKMEQALKEISGEHLPGMLRFVIESGNPDVFHLLFISLPGLVNKTNAHLFLDLLDSSSPELARMAIRQVERAGGKVLNEKVNARLLSLFENGDAYSRRLVLSNARRFGDKGIELLQRGLKDDSQWVREKARDELRLWKMHSKTNSKRN
ncbi:MAG: HEAT repeat domain-containing protein [Planctomycetota bacterium]|nr:HEAT repeat domain-containing protein [Planctomycetota bacterium]